MEEKKNLSSEIRLYKAYALERLYENEPNPKKALANKREEIWANYCMSIFRINDLVCAYYAFRDIEAIYGEIFIPYEESTDQFC